MRLTRRARRQVGVLAVLGTFSLLAAASGAPAQAADHDAPAGNTVVTVPALPVRVTTDIFRVGPFPSRLHVLFNDSGQIDPTSLGLVAHNGRVSLTEALGDLGRLRVQVGMVLLDQRPRAAGTAVFQYRVSSQNGEAQTGLATVELFDRVIDVGDDSLSTRKGSPVTIDVTSNDRLLVPGAERPCPPVLFASNPQPVHMVPLVLPEPARAPYTCDSTTTVDTKQGRWSVNEAGAVVFVPAAGFEGVARAWYQLRSEHPFDVGEARLTVTVGESDTGVLGGKHGPRGGRGPLPPTGAAVAAILALAVALLLVGARLRRTFGAKGASQGGNVERPLSAGS